MKSAIGPWVIQALSPVITYSSPCRTALVRIAPASEPACDSDRQYAPRVAPPSISGRKRLRCSSVPNSAIPLQDSTCTLVLSAIVAQPRASSSSTCR